MFVFPLRETLVPIANAVNNDIVTIITPAWIIHIVNDVSAQTFYAVVNGHAVICQDRSNDHPSGFVDELHFVVLSPRRAGGSA